jgi:hypothetical protein
MRQIRHEGDQEGFRVRPEARLCTRPSQEQDKLDTSLSLDTNVAG